MFTHSSILRYIATHCVRIEARFLDAPALESVLKLADDVCVYRGAVVEQPDEAHFDDVATSFCSVRTQLSWAGDLAFRGGAAHTSGAEGIAQSEALVVERDIVDRAVFVSFDVVDTADRDDLSIVEIANVFLAVLTADRRKQSRDIG
ncbi:hypothetical protein AB0O87_12125 [Microbacterium sp. NPDC076768]|uniref:hypothetical protein n=1 Tax=Microbacterium sp. NPDC076768 TaxID=3154858 RepID=UPI00343AD5F9